MSNSLLAFGVFIFLSFCVYRSIKNWKQENLEAELAYEKLKQALVDENNKPKSKVGILTKTNEYIETDYKDATIRARRYGPSYISNSKTNCRDYIEHSFATGFFVIDDKYIPISEIVHAWVIGVVCTTHVPIISGDFKL